jgi:hypothetical protein
LIWNINGIPLTKSGSSTFWPFIGRISNLKNADIIMAGLYAGCKKPSDINDYLKLFADEFIELSTKGFYFNRKLFVVRTPHVDSLVI